MKESDRSRDPYGPDDLQADLQEQLRTAIERSQQPSFDMEWTPEEQAQLNAEMARIPFSPDYANPDFADRVVLIEDGQETPVHAYNNFPMILALMDKLRRSDQPDQRTFEEAYAAVAEERRYYEIFEALEASSPALYKRSRQLFESKGRPKDHRGQNLSDDEVIHIQSQAYSAAAAIARKIDPGYNLRYLR